MALVKEVKRIFLKVVTLPWVYRELRPLYPSREMTKTVSLQGVNSRGILWKILYYLQVCQRM